VIHAIWKEGTHVLLTESKQRPNSCQITYVKSSIGEHSRNWDLQTDFFAPIRQRIYNYCVLIRDFLIVVDRKNAFDFLDVFRPLLSRMQISLPEADFSAEIASIQQLEVFLSRDVLNVISQCPATSTIQCMIYMKFLISCLLSNLCTKVMTFYFSEFSKNHEEIMALNTPREISLLTNLFSTVQEGKKPIAIAGGAHIISDRVISNLNKWGISFLLLTPKIPVQNKPIPAPNEQNHVTTPAAKVGPMDDRQQFMNLNFDALDGENFYEYCVLCDKAVVQERDRLKQEYEDITVLFENTKAL